MTAPLPRSLLALACGLLLPASVALAQQHDHAAMQMQDMPGMDMSSSKSASNQDTPKDAAKPVPKKKQGTPAAAQQDPHAGHHDMAMPMPVRDRQQQAPAKPRKPASPTPHAARHAPAPPAPAEGTGKDHATHDAMPMDMSMADGMPIGHDSAVAPPTFPPPSPEQLAAAFPDLGGMDMSLHMDDNPTIAVLRADRLEHAEGGVTAWDVRAGIGGNFDRFWLRSEGSQHAGEQAGGDIQLQWTHATGPWWDRVVSLRSDFGPGPSRQWAGIGVMGLAPYKFELEAHLYAGQSGRLAARLEAEYELLLTNRLILTPRLELNAYSKDDPANRIGQGFSDAETSLRLRYEFSRRFAPYAGYGWTRALGNTADFSRRDGKPELDHGWVAGVRLWF